MRNLFLWCGLMLSASSTFAQFNTPWTTNTSNSASSGYIGVGTKSTNGATNTPLPNFNFQVHGVADYIESVRGGGTLNHGKTSRIGLTNSISGNAFDDGAVLRMSENNFSILNQESGNFSLGLPSLILTFHNSSNRIWLGGSAQTGNDYAKFNIVVNDDHGLLIKTTAVGKTALKIKNHSDIASAIEIFGTSTAQPNFKVFGSGTVYARKYVTTLNNFPDYVFQPDYQLMPLTELRNYIQTNRHLPNVPSATTIESEGADLGELNRILVEKVEELTLYILQMETRINELEKQNVD